MSLAHRVEKLKRFFIPNPIPEIHSIIVEIGDTKESALTRYKKNNVVNDDDHFIFINIKPNKIKKSFGMTQDKPC